MTMANFPKTCLVIPCYNEESRLDFSKFENLPGELSFLFVNDGSADGTLKLLKSHESPKFQVLDLGRNHGKAEAVRRGMLYLAGLPSFKELEWAGYWDADLATPLSELEWYFKYMDLYAPGVSAVFGSRINRLGGKIERSFSRHLTGRLFAIFVKILFDLGTYDSQCGAKIFRRDAVIPAFEEEFISKWIFDVEIILRLKRKGIVMLECPLTGWRDVKGSKLMKPGSIAGVLYDLFRLWRRYG